MAEKESHTLRNSIIGTVIGGLILAFILHMTHSLNTVVLGALNLVAFPFIKGWSFLWSAHLIPGWLLLILCALAVVGFVVVYRRLRPTKNPAEPDYYGYTEDVFDGAKWRWLWVNGSPSDLRCFCPSCDGELMYDDSSWHDPFKRHMKKETLLFCEHCNRQVISRIEGGDMNYAVNVVASEIDRRIRTKEYKINE
jgi:hypothetical protein